jgi:hypothetical protein
LTIPAEAVYLSDNAQAALESLESGDPPPMATIARRARKNREILLLDCQHGEVVRESMIPDELRVRYGIENLYVEDLPDFWRMLYSIVKSCGKRVVVVLEIVDHKRYDRWFRLRRR